MSKIYIEDTDTFKHALTNLNKIEIAQIAQANDIEIDIKDTKEKIINYLLELLKDNKLTEKLYNSIRDKAFSVNKNFYDGFFYKFDNTLCKCGLEVLISEIKVTAKKDKNRIISVINERIKDEIAYFTCEITTSRPIYDQEEQRSRYFKEKISADVEIYFENGLVYVHSKNIIDNKKIKTFIQNSFNSANVLKNDKEKVKLIEPLFSEKIAIDWLENNKDKIKSNYSPFSIQMLDLLNSFSNKEGNFSNLSLKNIFFKHDILDTDNDDVTINELNYGGENLQRHYRIKEELKDGKKITGFKFEVIHSYIDDETEEEKYSILPIVILYEKKYALRISICTENVSAKEDILYRAYKDAKNIFMQKYNSEAIINSDLILEYLEIKKENVNNKTQKDKTEPQKNEGWVYNG